MVSCFCKPCSCSDSLLPTGRLIYTARRAQGLCPRPQLTLDSRVVLCWLPHKQRCCLPIQGVCGVGVQQQLGQEHFKHIDQVCAQVTQVGVSLVPAQALHTCKRGCMTSPAWLVLSKAPAAQTMVDSNPLHCCARRHLAPVVIC